MNLLKRIVVESQAPKSFLWFKYPKRRFIIERSARSNHILITEEELLRTGYWRPITCRQVNMKDLGFSDDATE